MTPPHLVRAVAAVLVLQAIAGCSGSEPSPAAAVGAATGPTAAADGLPTSSDQLGALLVTEVPSGLPQVPDDDLDPPAGAKTLDEIAGYAPDPEHEQQVLAGYGYQWGWERFWEDAGRQTTVFVDQFGSAAGAATYAEDLARNDAAYYGGDLREERPRGGDTCRALDVAQPSAERRGMSGPAAFVWCAHGVFSVAVTAASTSPDGASTELSAVLDAQLDRLPG